MGGAILGFCRWASLGHTGRMMLSLCKFCRTFSTDFNEPHFCFVQYQQTLSLQLITLHYAGAWVIHIRK